MIKNTFGMIVCAMALSVPPLWAADSVTNSLPKLPPYETSHLKVLKVYFAKEGDAIFLLTWLDGKIRKWS
jgi:hypothetical protein